MKSISIVIPTFNGQELLDTYLPSVIEACRSYKGEWEIIVVDDQSDSPVRRLREIRYIRREQNGGFSKAMNTGIKEARGEIIVSLNNDVKVNQDFIPLLLEYFDDQSVFSVKPKSMLPDGSNESVKMLGINKGMIESVTQEKLQLPDSGFQELPYSCAGSAAYDKNKLLELGGFDEIYSPFYWEDLDLGYRAVKRGWKNIYEPKSVVYHQHGATISKVPKVGPSGLGGISKQAVFIRNREIFYWKNVNDPKLNAIAFLAFFIRLLKAALLGKKDIVGGLLNFLKLFPMVAEKRKIEKKFSRVKDKEIVKKFIYANSR